MFTISNSALFSLALIFIALTVCLTRSSWIGAYYSARKLCIVLWVAAMLMIAVTSGGVTLHSAIVAGTLITVIYACIAFLSGLHISRFDIIGDKVLATMALASGMTTLIVVAVMEGTLQTL